MDAKFLSAKWGAFADNPNSPLLDMGNEAAWDPMHERLLEEFRRRQRSKIAASTSFSGEDASESTASPSNAPLKR